MNRSSNLLRAGGIAAALLTLAACAEGGVGSSRNRVYYADLQGGAKSCTVPPKVSLSNGGTTDAAMSLGNDGGWCGISVSRLFGPYDAGLLTQRPAHGRVHVHKVGDVSRIDYTPDPGFSGTDSFTVKMIPGDASLRVAVTVTGGSSRAAAAAPAASPAPTAAPAAKKPAAKK